MDIKEFAQKISGFEYPARELHGIHREAYETCRSPRSDVDGDFYGRVKVSCEDLSDLQIFFNDPSLAEDLGNKLLEMASELRKKQGE